MIEMNESLNEFNPTPESIAAGLVVEKRGEACFTDAGLFALAGLMAYASDTEADTRAHCLRGVVRALAVARAGGLSEQVEQIIQWAFAKGITPCDGGPEGVALATLCKLVAELVGKGRMSDVIKGNKPH